MVKLVFSPKSPKGFLVSESRNIGVWEAENCSLVPLKLPKTTEQNHWLHQLGRWRTKEDDKTAHRKYGLCWILSLLPLPSARALCYWDLPGCQFSLQPSSLTSITHVLLPMIFTWKSMKILSPLSVLLVLFSSTGTNGHLSLGSYCFVTNHPLQISLRPICFESFGRADQAFRLLCSVIN